MNNSIVMPTMVKFSCSSPNMRNIVATGKFISYNWKQAWHFSYISTISGKRTKAKPFREERNIFEYCQNTRRGDQALWKRTKST